MKLSDINRILFQNLKGLPGWRTGRKIVVIESDDWGSIRMPSRSVYQKLLRAGLDLNGGDGLRYSLFDSLEPSSDLELLYEVLNSSKDHTNTSAVLTANCVVANPDFEKIRYGCFQEYYYEPVTETIKRYSGCGDTYKLWKEGVNSRVFMPQFHGREHLNISAWMKALRAHDNETLMAFDEGMWAFMPKHFYNNGIEYEAAFQLAELSEIEEHKEILKDGLGLFEKLIGYKAEYFVPPNGRINNRLNITCLEKGIRFRSASNIQQEPVANGRNKKVLHWLGQKDSTGIHYIIRNCVFEPSQQGKDWVDSCLNDMKIAFRYHKPAIISTHRVNFIGIHDVANRDHGLKELARLLKSILKTWPEAEFMPANHLGNLIAGKK